MATCLLSRLSLYRPEEREEPVSDSPRRVRLHGSQRLRPGHFCRYTPAQRGIVLFYFVVSEQKPQNIPSFNCNECILFIIRAYFLLSISSSLCRRDRGAVQPHSIRQPAGAAFQAAGRSHAGGRKRRRADRGQKGRKRFHWTQDITTGPHAGVFFFLMKYETSGVHIYLLPSRSNTAKSREAHPLLK